MALDGRDHAAAILLLQARTAPSHRDPDRASAALRFQWALACAGMGEVDAAREHLLEGLRTGHAFGLVRTLLDVSPDVPRLLRDLLPRDGLETVLAFYVGRLLAAADRSRAPAAAKDAPDPTPPGPAALLSEREYEVLMLVAQAMPNKKIARLLDVTLDTVKFHLKNIYAKLGVCARDEAVARLRDIDAARDAGARG